VSDFPVFQSKPTLVEAIRWNTTAEVFSEVIDFTNEKCRVQQHPQGIDFTLEIQAGVDGASGWVAVPHGDWILRNPGDTTDIWPCDAARFDDKYEQEHQP
jgi:hypothetical protein